MQTVILISWKAFFFFKGLSSSFPCFKSIKAYKTYKAREEWKEKSHRPTLLTFWEKCNKNFFLKSKLENYLLFPQVFGTELRRQIPFSQKRLVN